MVHLTTRRALYLALVLPSVLAAEYLVGVGKDENTGKKGLGFDPSVINPQAGDVINFEFRSGQHSVVRISGVGTEHNVNPWTPSESSFDNPCVGSGGFNSGVQTVDDSLAVDAPGLPSVKLTVNDTNPLWFFDEAGGECSQGAVLAANPTEAQSAAAFKANAAKAPAQASSSSSTPSGSTSASSTASTTSSSPTQSTNAASVLTYSHAAAAVFCSLLLSAMTTSVVF